MSPWVWLFGFYWIAGWSVSDIARLGSPTQADMILAIVCLVGREIALLREGK